MKVASLLAIPSYQLVNTLFRKKRGTQIRLCHRIAAGLIIIIVSMICGIFVDSEYAVSSSIGKVLPPPIKSTLSTY